MKLPATIFLIMLLTLISGCYDDRELDYYDDLPPTGRDTYKIYAFVDVEQINRPHVRYWFLESSERKILIDNNGYRPKETHVALSYFLHQHKLNAKDINAVILTDPSSEWLDLFEECGDSVFYLSSDMYSYSQSKAFKGAHGFNQLFNNLKELEDKKQLILYYSTMEIQPGMKIYPVNLHMGNIKKSFFTCFYVGVRTKSGVVILPINDDQTINKKKGSQLKSVFKEKALRQMLAVCGGDKKNIFFSDQVLAKCRSSIGTIVELGTIEKTEKATQREIVDTND